MTALSAVFLTAASAALAAASVPSARDLSTAALASAAASRAFLAATSAFRPRCSARWMSFLILLTETSGPAFVPLPDGGPPIFECAGFAVGRACSPSGEVLAEAAARVAAAAADTAAAPPVMTELPPGFVPLG